MRLITTEKATSSLERIERRIKNTDRNAHRLKMIALVLFFAWMSCSLLSFQFIKKPEAVTSGFGYINK